MKRDEPGSLHVKQDDFDAHRLVCGALSGLEWELAQDQTLKITEVMSINGYSISPNFGAWLEQPTNDRVRSAFQQILDGMKVPSALIFATIRASASISTEKFILSQSCME